MNIPKTLAKIGSVYIEEAILVVLEGEEGLRPEEISERLGIPTETDGILCLANAIVLGFLTKLKLEGRVQDTDERPNVPRRWSLPNATLGSDGELLTVDWTVDRFNELLNSQEYSGFYESRNQVERLSEFGVDLMNLVEQNQWELTPKFRKYSFALYFGHRRVFGVYLGGRPKLAVWLSEDVLAERNNDLFDDQYTYTYHNSYRCGIYPEYVTVADIEGLLEFAYLSRAGLIA